MLEGPVTLSEYLEALEHCALDRSPGLDGLPYEFYISVKTIIAPMMVKIINIQLDNNSELIPSQRMGVTRLIPKVSHIPSVKELRPITLLACDYKIMSKIVTTRILSVLDDILISSQLCCHKEKNILFGASDFISTIDYVNSKQINSFLVSYDIFKAYDKTNISFISKVMQKMNFSEKFCKWVKLFHSNIQTQFILDSLTTPINVLNSLRQGDPLAMPLFLINIEPLILKIGRTVEGVKVGGAIQTEEGYVDDVNVISTRPEELSLIDGIFHRFEDLSGTVLNRSRKCKVMGMVGWRGRTNWPLPWLQPVDSVKVFGITFCPTVPETITLSWEDCQEKFRKCLFSWGERVLPHLSQKSFVLKVFAASKLWYLAQVLPVPKNTIKYVERLMGDFLWKGRHERLALPELCNAFQDGGLALPNIQAKCDALFLKHLLRIFENESKTRDHLLYWVGLGLRNMFPDLVPPLRAELLTPYYKHCIALLNDRALDDPITSTNIGNFKVKTIYGMFNSTPPPPKVMGKISLNWERVWRRLNSKIISRDALDILFTVLHDIYPNNVRLNRCGQHPSRLCTKCPDRVAETNIHLFTECRGVLPGWIYLKNKLVTNGVINHLLVDDKLCLYLDLEVSPGRLDIYTFLLSRYILYVHRCRKSGVKVHIDTLRGFLVHEKPLDFNVNL